MTLLERDYRLNLPSLNFYLNTKPEMGNLWNALSSFCTPANLAFESNQKITLSQYQEQLVRSAYRLIHFELSTETPALEIQHLAMLAFSTTVFLQILQNE
jgi:hypothetical protein